MCKIIFMMGYVNIREQNFKCRYWCQLRNIIFMIVLSVVGYNLKVLNSGSKYGFLCWTRGGSSENDQSRPCHTQKLEKKILFFVPSHEEIPTKTESSAGWKNQFSCNWKSKAVSPYIKTNNICKDFKDFNFK